MADLFSLHGFVLFGGFLGVVMGFGHAARGFTIRNLTLAAFLVCVGFLQTMSAVFHSGQLDRHPILFLVMIPAVMLAGPLLFGLYQLLFDERFRYRPGILIHLLPATVSAFYLAWRHSDLEVLVQQIRRHQGTGDLDEFRMLLIAGVTLVVVYVTYCIFKAAVFWNRTRRDSRIGGGFVAGIYFLFALTALIGLAGDVRVLVLAINAGTTFLFIGLYIAEQKYPDMIGAIALAVKKRREQSHLRGLDLAEVKARLIHLMEKEKPFCDEDLSLPALAELIGISPHQLSELLNEHLEQNFNRFVNDFRVREAKHLLVEEPARSILSVGMAVGFNSTSAFHHSFRQHTGLTPARFRKTALQNPANS